MAISKVVSIEITDLVTRVSEMSYNKKNPTVYKSVIFDNPEYSVDDGFVTDRTSYGAELKSQLAAAKIKCKDVVFVLASNKVVSREVTIPEMKPELIMDLIESDRGEYFPMDTSSHIFTYTVLEKLKAEKQLRIMVYAAPDILIKNYQALAAEIDLRIQAIDNVGNAVYQHLHSLKDQMSLYLQVNEKNSLFTILENGGLALQRSIGFGAYTLTSALAFNGYYGKELDAPSGLVKLVENDLLYHSFVEMEDANPEDSAADKLHQCKSYLTEAVRPFISNISRVLEYYNTKNREATVTHIYIGGIGAKVAGLKQLIESEFNGIEVVVVEKLPGVRMNSKCGLPENRSTELIATLGAGTLTINFYKGNEKKKMEKTLVFCILAVVLVTIAAIFIVLNGKMVADQAQAKQAKLTSQLQQIEALGIEALQNEYNRSEMSIIEVEDMDAATFNYNEYWNDIMAYLESESVADVVISSISSTDSGVTLNMVVSSKEEAAKTLLQYRKIPYFSSVTINGITENIDEESGFTTVNFTLLCEYNFEGVIEQ